MLNTDKFDSSRIKFVNTGQLSSSSGVFVYSSSAIKKTSIVFVQPNYDSGDHTGFVTTAQAQEGRLNIYTRKAGGELPANGTKMAFYVLIIN